MWMHTHLKIKLHHLSYFNVPVSTFQLTSQLHSTTVEKFRSHVTYTSQAWVILRREVTQYDWGDERAANKRGAAQEAVSFFKPSSSRLEEEVIRKNFRPAGRCCLSLKGKTILKPFPQNYLPDSVKKQLQLRLQPGSSGPYSSGNTGGSTGSFTLMVSGEGCCRSSHGAKSYSVSISL